MFRTGVIVRNTLVKYDREHQKIGFWKTNCSELWERLRANDSSTPMPSASDNTNSSLGTPPVVAPSGPTNDVLPGISCEIYIVYSSYMNLFTSLFCWISGFRLTFVLSERKISFDIFFAFFSFNFWIH